MSIWRGFLGPKQCGLNQVTLSIMTSDCLHGSKQKQHNMEGQATREEVNRGDGDCVAGGPESTSCTSTG